MKKRAGFSLIELLLTLLLIGITVVLAISAGLRGMRRWNLRDDARQITSTYYWLRQWAARENRPTKMDIVGNAVGVYFRPALDWVSIRQPEALSEKVRVLEGNIALAINSRGFLINPDTLMLTGNPVVITLESQGQTGNDLVTITIYPYGGLYVQKAFK